jgi:hypothetical protein
MESTQQHVHMVGEQRGDCCEKHGVVWQVSSPAT